MPSMFVVKATFDEEAGVWFTESTDIPGLHIEADSLDALRAKLPAAIEDLFEQGEGDAVDVPVELIAHASSRVRVKAYAEGARTWATTVQRSAKY